MKKTLPLLAIALALSVNAYAFQVADSQYNGGYNGLDLNTAETLFNNLSPKGGGGGAPLGAVIIWTQAGNPEDWENWHDCDGATDSKMSGSQVCVEKGICAAPNFTGRFLRQQGGNGGAVNTQQNDAIRNITGWFRIYESTGLGGNGAFSTYQTGGGTQQYRSGGPPSNFNASFDASRVVPVANENRPLSHTVRYLIRINE